MSLYHSPSNQEQALWSRNNFRMIEPDEIVIDCDNKEGLGDRGVLRMCLLLSEYGDYRIELYRADGQKSYHAHIKNIPLIADLTLEQNKKYKELLLQKVISEIRKITEAPELDNIDFSLCSRHAIAEENKLHYKYGTIKKLIHISNPECENHIDREIYEQALQIKDKKLEGIEGETLSSKINAKLNIIDLARMFGLSVNSKGQALCPFHPDNNTPSLKLDAEKGLFICFGCRTGGNIIKFYAKLKKLSGKSLLTLQTAKELSQ